MKRELDDILRQALAPEEEPDACLNRKLINQMREMENVPAKSKRRVSAAAVAICVLLAGTVTAVAAQQYLSPAQVSEEMEDKKLTEVFQGEDAVSINETQVFDDYRITLLGMAAGEEISDTYWMQDDELVTDEMYLVVAIERTDGKEIRTNAANPRNFYISPYIQGFDPIKYNRYTFGGICRGFIQDGVQYVLVEIRNISVFADREIYLGINTGSYLAQDAFLFDEETGKISRNEEYKWVNALFLLPIDAKLADPGKAKELTGQWQSKVIPE